MAGQAKARRAKRKKAFGKPPRFLYSAAFLLLKPLYRLRYGVRVDRAGLAGLRGPALVVAPHTSGKDHVLLGMALYPERPTFVLSEHFMARPLLRPLLRLMRVITKKMFCADVGTILQMLRASRSGNVLVLFPEGRLPWIGHSGPMTEGTATLAKKLGVPVYGVTANGAYLTFPKWGRVRRGSIRVTTERLFTAEELAAADEATVQARLAAYLTHDDEAAMPSVRYRCHDTTAGLDNVLCKCPGCGAEKRLTAGGGHIRCGACGLDAVLGEDWRLSGVRFGSVNAWYDWQVAQTDPHAVSFDCEARLGAVNARGNMDTRAGRARLVYDASVFRLTGELFGAPFSAELPSAKITAMPLTVGQHFDVYIGGKLVYVYPADPRDVVRCAILCDRLREARG